MYKNYSFTISQVVAAADSNRAIGANGQLLWHLPEDLRFFKNLTWGMPVVMGRKTFAGINKPLPGRTNVILTRGEFKGSDDIVVVQSIEEAMACCDGLHTNEIFVIGGGEIYRQFMPYSDKIFYTRVYAAIENADAFYPELEQEDWVLVNSFRKEADEKNAYAMQFETWERR